MGGKEAWRFNGVCLTGEWRLGNGPGCIFVIDVLYRDYEVE